MKKIDSVKFEDAIRGFVSLPKVWTVKYAENSLDNLVIVKSKDKEGKPIYIQYCHLDTVKVAEGDKVKHNEVIGTSGSTGNASHIEVQYRHIHIEASTNGIFFGGNTRVDPEQFMNTKFDSNGNSIN